MKKTLLSVLTLVLAAFAVKSSGGTVLKGGKDYYFFYNSYNSGTAVEVYKPSPSEIRFGASLKEKIGERCEIGLSDLGEFLTDLRANFVAEEKGEDFFNLYYYSPLIRENVTIGGKKVNLHVSFDLKSGDLSDIGYVTVATPVNYGGY